MKAETASAYCDLSRPAFLGEVAAGRLPAPVNLGGRDHWLQPALEKALAMIAGSEEIPDYRKELQRRYG